MKRIAVYPGSFDPVTKGHMDIIKRSKELFHNLKIGILINSSKNSWFTTEERVKMVQMCMEEVGIEAEVMTFRGLLVDFMKNQEADILVRGLRAVSDYEYELQFTLTNTLLTERDFETIFLTASREFLYLSSSLVKEIAINKGNLAKFVPNSIVDLIEKRAEEISNKK